MSSLNPGAPHCTSVLLPKLIVFISSNYFLCQYSRCREHRSGKRSFSPPRSKSAGSHSLKIPSGAQQRALLLAFVYSKTQPPASLALLRTQPLGLLERSISSADDRIHNNRRPGPSAFSQCHEASGPGKRRHSGEPRVPVICNSRRP